MLRSWGEAREDLVKAAVLAVAAVCSYLLATGVLSRLYSASRADDLIGGLWTLISTVFVFRDSHEHSVAAAISRVSATAASFVLCLIYLAFLPFSVWGLAILVGASALAVTLIGRSGDAITAAITTAVVMISAGISPGHAWRQPILRLADTVVGVVIGVAAAWLAQWLARQLAPRTGGAEPRTPGS
jgi:uncharacterized membrane protein YccC